VRTSGSPEAGTKRRLSPDPSGVITYAGARPSSTDTTYADSDAARASAAARTDATAHAHADAARASAAARTDATAHAHADAARASAAARTDATAHAHADAARATAAGRGARPTRPADAASVERVYLYRRLRIASSGPRDLRIGRTASTRGIPTLPRRKGARRRPFKLEFLDFKTACLIPNSGNHCESG
jgi:hypothetical protein